TRLALDEGLLHDLDLAPDWLDPAHAPLALLARACTMGGPRGLLACAALELLDTEGVPGAVGGIRLCPSADRPPRECAATIALDACNADDNAEACFLAARADLSTARDARSRLDVLCTQLDSDQPACVYHYARQRDEKSLIAACAELDSVRTGSLATACLERA